MLFPKVGFDYSFGWKAALSRPIDESRFEVNHSSIEDEPVYLRKCVLKKRMFRFCDPLPRSLFAGGEGHGQESSHIRSLLCNWTAHKPGRKGSTCHQLHSLAVQTRASVDLTVLIL